ncbi:MAG: diaminopimelate decarboxylase [Mariniblastus sp.]|jgi:diaminopimelate decarboxylase
MTNPELSRTISGLILYHPIFWQVMTVQQKFSTVRTEISGHSIQDLAKKYGSPTYVYEAQTIRDRIEQLRQFDVIRFAQKANSNLAILDLMRKNGVVVDAVSSGEVFRASKAGFEFTGTPAPIVFTADIFDREALELVVEKQLHVNVGSPDMIEQYGQRVPGGKITIRINPGFGHGHSAKTNTGGESSKHGIWHDQLEDCLTLAAKHQVAVTGLHMHIGSGTDFEHLSQVCDAMLETARRVGDSITTISAGGGLPTPYRDSDVGLDIDRYYQLWDQSRKQLESEFGHAVSLEIEPGRFLVAECGFLISEIRAIKKMGSNLFYLVDAGFNNLARPILYGAYHPMSVAFSGDANEETQDAIVGGPLCESGDIFTQEEGGFVCSRELPVASVGDFLVIECAGAYGHVMSSNYNSKPFAAEVLIEGGQDYLIRRRQTSDDLIAGEIIPS